MDFVILFLSRFVVHIFFWTITQILLISNPKIQPHFPFIYNKRGTLCVICRFFFLHTVRKLLQFCLLFGSTKCITCVCRCCLLSQAKNEWMRKKERKITTHKSWSNFVCCCFFFIWPFFFFLARKKHYFYWLKRRTACKEINSVFFSVLGLVF